MEENRDSRNKLTCIWSTDFQQGFQVYMMGKGQMAWEIGCPNTKELDPYFKPYIKINSKWIKNLMWDMKHKNTRRKHRGKTS